MMQKNTHRYIVLDGLRGIAAISVCIYHLTQHSLYPILESSNFAVDLFFCLSGFVIAYAYTDKLKHNLSTKQFLLKRLARLYPMYLVGIAIGAVALFLKIQVNETSLNPTSTFAAIALNTLYLPYIGDFWIKIGLDRVNSATFPTNAPAWSLFFELLVNIALVLVIRNFRKSRKIIIIATILAAIGLIFWCVIERQSAPGWGASNIFGGIPRSFYGFFSGVLIWQLKDKKISFQIHPWYLVAILIICFIIISRHWLLWLFATLLISPALVLFGSTSTLRNATQMEIFRWLGNISYPLYCIHSPLYSVACTLFNASITTSISSIFASVLSAHMLQKYIEPIASKKLAAILK